MKSIEELLEIEKKEFRLLFNKNPSGLSEYLELYSIIQQEIYQKEYKDDVLNNYLSLKLTNQIYKKNKK